MRPIRLLALLALLASSLPTARAQEWGSLTGRFLLDGPVPAPAAIAVPAAFRGAAPVPPPVDESVVAGANGELAKVVIWVRTPKDIKTHPDYAGLLKRIAVIDNSLCRFDPHIVVCRVGQPLDIKNSDPVAHNVNVSLVANQPLNFIIPANAVNAVKPFLEGETLPASVTCNIQPWMKGFLIVPPTPYAAVSGQDGTFEIQNLPVGVEIEFQAWQEKKGYLDKVMRGGKDPGWTRGRFKMKIEPGKNDLGDVKVSL